MNETKTLSLPLPLSLSLSPYSDFSETEDTAVKKVVEMKRQSRSQFGFKTAEMIERHQTKPTSIIIGPFLLSLIQKTSIRSVGQHAFHSGVNVVLAKLRMTTMQMLRLMQVVLSPRG